MSKKTIIISVAALAALSVGIFFAYQQGYFFKKEAVLTPANLLVSFKVKSPNLTPEAIGIFNQRFNDAKAVLQKNPDSFNDWLYLGVLKKGVGDYEGARDVFIYAGQIRPQASTPFANLADLYAYFLNDPAKAEESIKKAIANDPKDYNLYLVLADIYRYKFQDGAAKYEQTMIDTIAKFSDNVNLIGPLASFYKQTGQAQKAIEWYEKLVKLTPDNAAVKADLAELKKIKN